MSKNEGQLGYDVVGWSIQMANLTRMIHDRKVY